MAPESHTPRPRRPWRAPARLLLLALVLAAAGCADTPSTAPPPQAQPSPDDPVEGEPSPVDLDANLTEGCIDRYAPGADYFPDKVRFDEATSVTVDYQGHYKVLEVGNPALAGGTPLRYVLLQCGAPAPDLTGELDGAQVVEVPVREVVTLTTTNLPHFAELGIVDRLAGVGTGGFVVTPEVVERIEAGEVPDYADAAGQPDLERLLDARPDLLVVDGFGEAILDDVRRFTDAGVPTAVNADFHERTLLGRAEWLKFTALFTNTEARAEEVYAGIRDRYHERREAAGALPGRPRVLVNTPYEGTWFVPGGDSFLANAIADAGGEYVFAGTEGTGSLAYDVETVLDAAADADVWVQAGSVRGSLDDLLAIDERFASFKAFTEGEVWAWDAWVTDGGGHAVFEVAYTRADLFLDDLVAALHPGVRDGIDLTFFGKVGSAR